MGLTINYKDGQTPLNEEEKEGLLIKSITTHQELDEFEQMNIERAIEWTLIKKFKMEYVLSEKFIKELHYKMFNNVWRWAGKFRLSEKNLGVRFHLISTELKQLNDDCQFWIRNQTYSEEEIAIRYKHRIVYIHCFPNGNGRHSRLMADIIISHLFNKNVFTWSSASLVNGGEQRTTYLNAIKEADKHDIKPLIDFAKS